MHICMYIHLCVYIIHINKDLDSLYDTDSTSAKLI